MSGRAPISFQISRSTVRLVLPMRTIVPFAADEVAAVERRQELDLLVAGEEALVAVGADRQLGDDVAEQLEPMGAVDEVAAVVHVRRREPHPQLDTHPLHVLLLFRAEMIRVTPVGAPGAPGTRPACARRGAGRAWPPPGSCTPPPRPPRRRRRTAATARSVGYPSVSATVNARPISPDPLDAYDPARASPSSGRSASRRSCCGPSGASVAHTAMHEPSADSGRLGRLEPQATRGQPLAIAEVAHEQHAHRVPGDEPRRGADAAGELEAHHAGAAADAALGDLRARRLRARHWRRRR